MPHHTRRSPQKSSINPIQAKFSPLPVQQPKAQNKADQPLPEVKPGGVRAVSPLQRLIDSQTIQAKLTIGEPNDQYEQEADAVAKDVVQRINAPVSEEAPQETVQRETLEDEELLNKKSIVQRETLEEELDEDEDDEDLLNKKSIVQRVEAVGGGEASTELESSINRAKGGGQALDEGLQESMGQAMGADFSGVRVHTDSHADQLNQSIQAKAFTTGQDVFFKKGEYQPGSKTGQELIAHELTHVVQQNTRHNDQAIMRVVLPPGKPISKKQKNEYKRIKSYYQVAARVLANRKCAVWRAIEHNEVPLKNNNARTRSVDEMIQTFDKNYNFVISCYGKLLYEQDDDKSSMLSNRIFQSKFLYNPTQPPADQRIDEILEDYRDPQSNRNLIMQLPKEQRKAMLKEIRKRSRDINEYTNILISDYHFSVTEALEQQEKDINKTLVKGDAVEI